MIRQSTIKITYAGETKRVQTPADFSQLLQTTQLNFATLNDAKQSMTGYKFFLLDEDKELISISSQADFDDNSDQIIIQNQSTSSAVPALIYSDSATDAAQQLKALMQSKLANAAAISESAVSSSSGKRSNEMMKMLEKGLQEKLKHEVE